MTRGEGRSRNPWFWLTWYVNSPLHWTFKTFPAQGVRCAEIFEKTNDRPHTRIRNRENQRRPGIVRSRHQFQLLVIPLSFALISQFQLLVVFRYILYLCMFSEKRSTDYWRWISYLSLFSRPGQALTGVFSSCPSLFNGLHWIEPLPVYHLTYLVPTWPIPVTRVSYNRRGGWVDLIINIFDIY